MEEEKIRPPQPYKGEIPFGYELYNLIRYDEEGREHKTPQLKKSERSDEEYIEKKIVYLRAKLVKGEITPEEREELKLLIG